MPGIAELDLTEKRLHRAGAFAPSERLDVFKFSAACAIRSEVN